MTNLIERFESKIFYSPCGCWCWTDKLNSCGYGRIRIDGCTYIASRVSYEIFKGYPGDLHVLHSCDNPACVNPDHLFLGTHQENMEDMRKKGRAHRLKGERNPSARLNETDVMAIKAMAGVHPMEIAKQFNVCRMTVCNILSGKNWRHIQ